MYREGEDEEEAEVGSSSIIIIERYFLEIKVRNIRSIYVKISFGRDIRPTLLI
jgi:hypothetical protein